MGTKKLCEVLEQNAFLAVEDVVLGGAGGKGVVTKGQLESQVVLFVKQLPTMDHAKWLPHIMETLQAVLEINMKDPSAQIKMADGVLSLKLKKDVRVTVAVSPVYKNRAALLECIRNSPPAQRVNFQWSFVREHVDFIGSQSQETKVVIRLVTWWAMQQPWSSDFTRPSEYLLELVCVHASEQLKAQSPDLTDMLEFIFEIFANFDTIKVLWADTGAAHYTLKDIWKPLLSHEPLFMDPVNPYCNLVDANRFDAHELVTFASAANRLEVFQKEAATLPFVKASFELPAE